MSGGPPPKNGGKKGENDWERETRQSSVETDATKLGLAAFIYKETRDVLVKYGWMHIWTATIGVN